MTHNKVLNKHKVKRIIIHIQSTDEDNPMHPSSSIQWLCGDMSAMNGQWQSSRTISVKTNRVFSKH